MLRTPIDYWAYRHESLQWKYDELRSGEFDGSLGPLHDQQERLLDWIVGSDPLGLEDGIGDGNAVH